MTRAVTHFRIVAGAVLAALSPISAPAQTYVVHKMDPAPQKGFQELHVSKAAVAGQKVRIWAATLLNPDCTAAGTITTQVIEQPHHGQVKVSDDAFYPNYAQPNPRAACDTRKSPGKQLFYTADASFHGHDKTIIQNATSEGKIRRIVIDIDVR